MQRPDAKTASMLQETSRLVLPVAQNETVQRRYRSSAQTRNYIARTPAGGIPAAAGDTPGVAVCVLYKFGAGTPSLTPQLDQSGAQVQKEIVNISSDAVAGDAYISCKQEVISGRLIADSGGGGGPTVIEFTTDAAFSEPNDSVGATVTKVWSGSEASASVMVYNTCNMFAGNAGDCGVAISNADDGGRYQIIQLRCPTTIVSDQKFWFDVGQGDSISYADTPTPIPYSFEGAGSLGDLLTLEADGSVTFARDPTGPITIGLFALISDILGIGSDGDKSILQVDYDDLGGGGYQTLDTATAVQHPYFRVPPNNYGMGGSTYVQWTTSLGGTGHKLRVTVQTANGNIVSSEFLQSYVQVSES